MTERVSPMRMGGFRTGGAIALLLAAGVTACNKVPLLAPSGSTINLSASTRTLPVNGSTGLTAFVTESSGTPVQNGTTVRFTTTLGSVSPVETQTTNGLAVANFLAGGIVRRRRNPRHLRRRHRNCHRHRGRAPRPT